MLKRANRCLIPAQKKSNTDLTAEMVMDSLSVMLDIKWTKLSWSKKKNGPDNLWNHGGKQSFTLTFMLKGKRDATNPCTTIPPVYAVWGLMQFVSPITNSKWDSATELASRMAVDFSSHEGWAIVNQLFGFCHSSHVCACKCVFKCLHRKQDDCTLTSF